MEEKRRSRSKIFLKEWRKYRKLTQPDVAELIEVDQSTLSRIESGKLPFNEDLLVRLAQVYGCDPADFLTNNPLRPDPPRVVADKLKGAPKEIQERALAVIEALLKAG